MVIEEFLEWQNETKTAIELWTIRLKNEALKQGSYEEAIDYLNRNCPDLPRDYQGSANKRFQSVIRSMFDEDKKMVYDEAQSQEIKHE
ncbi:hypothetical protein [Lactobacillus apis]|uniref:hypothetical protein n=1 Tax=Lactobacillus apis TaxID=303541 RepID=UPI00164FA543|nr:hypothetical protein [Lactobacillus apis]MBC6360547.1 hypothetical protein [Lactobacillus apis]